MTMHMPLDIDTFSDFEFAFTPGSRCGGFTAAAFEPRVRWEPPPVTTIRHHQERPAPIEMVPVACTGCGKALWAPATELRLRGEEIVWFCSEACGRPRQLTAHVDDEPEPF